MTHSNECGDKLVNEILDADDFDERMESTTEKMYKIEDVNVFSYETEVNALQKNLYGKTKRPSKVRTVKPKIATQTQRQTLTLEEMNMDASFHKVVKNKLDMLIRHNDVTSWKFGNSFQRTKLCENKRKTPLQQNMDIATIVGL